MKSLGLSWAIYQLTNSDNHDNAVLAGYRYIIYHFPEIQLPLQIINHWTDQNLQTLHICQDITDNKVITKINLNIAQLSQM